MKWQEEDTEGVHYNMIVNMNSLWNMGVEISIDLDGVSSIKEVECDEEFMLVVSVSAIVSSIVRLDLRF